MIPKSLSATALQTADGCLARYWAENYVRADGPGARDAADLGTAVHATLEWYVKTVYIDKLGFDNFDFLKARFIVDYCETFDTSEHEGPLFADGLKMLKDWYNREGGPLSGVAEVLSAEVKETFAVKTSVGEIPFNYIWDRCDRLEDEDNRVVIRVVDYKTVRMPVTAEQLHAKIQARCYALAAQIKYPQADEIWIQFDLLRYSAVGTRFTREENIATWNWLKASAERIIAADETDIEALENLNSECAWCVRKTSCAALRDNVLVGGVFSVADTEEALVKLSQAQILSKANKQLADELEAYIYAQAEKEDKIEFDTDTVSARFAVSSRRAFDFEKVASVLGPDLVARYGSINLTTLDNLIKDGRLTPEQENDIKNLIYKTTGEPRLKITTKNSLGS